TDDETLVIAMSDDLDVNSVTTNTLDVANNATIGGALNVTGQTTLSGGLSMDGNRITNVAAGIDGTDAVNVDQLTNVSDVANAGWNVQTNGDTATNVAPGDTVQMIDGQNIAITRNGTDITVATADDVEFTNVEVTENLNVAGDTHIGGSTTINENLTVAGETRLGDNFFVNNEGNVTYDGAITEGNHIVNKEYVDGGIGDLADTPITFGGDTGSTDRQLGERLDIVTSNANLSTEVTDDETLVIAMSDDLDVNSVTANTLDVANNATIGGALNVTGQTTLSGGLSMDGNRITNVAAGIDGTDAVNVDQLTNVSDVANAGWNVQTNGDTATNVAPGDTVQMIDGQNIAITRNGTDITVATADDVEFTNVEVTENLNVAGETRLGDNFFVNNEGNVTYDGDITEGNHITNKDYVDNSVTELGDTPLTFGANEGGDTERRLGERLDIVGEADEEGNSNIITKLSDEQTLEVALNDDLNIGNSLTVGDTFIDGDSITTNNMVTNNATVNENLSVAGNTTLAGNLTVEGDTVLGNTRIANDTLVVNDGSLSVA
ncbi:hypothetical protein CPA45_22415, partial [Vreelandella nigrificans]